MQRLFLIYVIFFISCGSKNQDSITEEILNGIQDSGQGFIKQIPINKYGKHKGEYDFMYKFMMWDARSLGLDSLDGGYNSIQIRIWLGHSLAKEKQVVILSNTASRWRGRVITYTEKYEEDSVRGGQIGKEVIESSKDINPVDGWNNLLEKLIDLKITTLSNSDDIPGYNGCGEDGISYFFEISTTKEYRFYYYCNPEDNATKFWQAKNVLQFAELLEKEFGFHYTR